MVQVWMGLTIKLNHMSNHFYLNSSAVKETRPGNITHSQVNPLFIRSQGQHKQPRPYSSFYQESNDPRPPPRDINHIKNEAILKQTSYKPDLKMQRSSSGYITSEIRKLTDNSSNNQETTGIFPFQSKLGEKIRQYAQYEHNENRLSLNTNNDSKKNLDNSIEVQKITEFKEWVSSELIKISERLSKNEHKIQSLDKRLSNNQRSGSFSNQQTQELNRIISLVEKAGNRQDHKRTAKMIEQMRQNILELHQTVSQLTIKHQSIPTLQSSRDNQLEREIASLKTSVQELLKKQAEKYDIASKIKLIEGTIEDFKKEWLSRPRLVGTSVSVNKCPGPVTTLKIEENMSSIAQKDCTSEHQQADKEVKSATISTSVYYIDSEGFLLDADRYYLLNEKQEQIKLTELELQMLQKHGLF